MTQTEEFAVDAGALYLVDGDGNRYTGGRLGIATDVVKGETWLSLSGIGPAGKSRLTLQADTAAVAGNLSINTTDPKRKLHVEDSEIHAGGPHGGYSFSNRGSAFSDNPGERWVLYGHDNTASLWTGGKDVLTVDAKGNMTITGDLHVNGSLLEVRQETIVVRNGGNDSPGKWNWDFRGQFGQVYTAIVAVQGFTVFGDQSDTNVGNFTVTNMHSADVGGIPQHVWATLDGLDVNHAAGRAYCSESKAGNEYNNGVLLTVTVFGRK